MYWTAVFTVERIAHAMACSMRWTLENQSWPRSGVLVQSISAIVRCVYGLLLKKSEIIKNKLKT